jgi:BON domain
MHRSLLHISLILLSLCWLGCSKHPSDEQIRSDIQAKVAADPETKDSEISVASKDGNVAIEGKVRNPTARQKVEEIAKAEPGVSEIHDETVVPSNSEAATQSSSEQVATAAKAMEVKEPAPAPPSPPPPPPVVVQAGTVLTVRTDQDLSSKTSQTGQTFTATLAQPISVRGRPALPAGSTVSGTVVNATTKGKIKGEGQLDLALTSISIGAHTYPIHTTVLSSTQKGKGKRTAATTGGGAAGGALIGGLAGGGKGAGIGALVGAGAGFVGGALTGNKQIEIPAESALSFTLSEPLTVKP